MELGSSVAMELGSLVATELGSLVVMELVVRALVVVIGIGSIHTVYSITM